MYALFGARLLARGGRIPIIPSATQQRGAWLAVAVASCVTLAIGVTIDSSAGWFMAPLAGGLVYILVALAAGSLPMMLVIGDDGIRIAGLFQHRFFALAQIQSIQVIEGIMDPSRVQITVGAKAILFRIDAHPQRGPFSTAAVNKHLNDLHEDLVAKIRTRMDCAKSAPTPDPLLVTELKDRDTRTFSIGRSPYRERSWTNKDLWRVVECNLCEPSVRAAAAEALVRNGEDDWAGRLRDIAKQSANPRLSRIFRRVAKRAPVRGSLPAHTNTD
jgi:hypothetical protein